MGGRAYFSTRLSYFKRAGVNPYKVFASLNSSEALVYIGLRNCMQDNISNDIL